MLSPPLKIWKNIRRYLRSYEKYLSKPQRRHFQTYLMGMMLPPDKRRKSVNAINELLGTKHQSSLNRFLHGSAGKLLKSIRDSDLVKRLKGHRLALVLDDTLLEHPYAEKMEGVSSFYDITKKQEVQGHQLVTAVLVDLETKEAHPIDVVPYLKVEYFLNGCRCRRCKDVPNRASQLGIKPCKCKNCQVSEFQTKIHIAKKIFLHVKQRFRIDYVAVDSWYASRELFEAIGEVPYVTELKGNRWVWQIGEYASNFVLPKFPKCHGGKRYQKQARKTGWKKFKEIAEEAVRKGKFTPRNDPHIRDVLVNFTHQYHLKLGFTDGTILNVLVLYDPKSRDFKFLCSNDLSLRCEDFINLVRIRWRIEEFHKDVKDLGLGEYQLRELRTVLIHGHIALLAYSLLRELLANSVKLFGKALNTIGECSRAIKEIFLYRRTIKKWWAG